MNDNSDIEKEDEIFENDPRMASDDFDNTTSPHQPTQEGEDNHLAEREFPSPIKYSTFKEIEYDLKRLSLERQIVLEELKAIKYEFKEDLRPAGWLDTIVSYISRLGGVILLRKLFFRK